MRPSFFLSHFSSTQKGNIKKKKKNRNRRELWNTYYLFFESLFNYANEYLFWQRQR